MDEEFDLEEQAARCRRLARSVNDREAVKRLLKLAEEYEAKARRVREQPPGR
jgi:hypothetical protein